MAQVGTHLLHFTAWDPGRYRLEMKIVWPSRAEAFGAPPNEQHKCACAAVEPNATAAAAIHVRGPPVQLPQQRCATGGNTPAGRWVHLGDDEDGGGGSGGGGAAELLELNLSENQLGDPGLQLLAEKLSLAPRPQQVETAFSVAPQRATARHSAPQRPGSISSVASSAHPPHLGVGGL